MALGLALPLVASLLELASMDVQLGVRGEGRSTMLSSPGVPDDTRGSYAAAPRATVRAEAARLRLTATYAPRLWVSDVDAQSSPLVSHTLNARIETSHDAAWRAEATAAATRGTTDPLADPWQAAAAAAGRVQVATTEPLDYEELRTGAATEVSLGGRSTGVAAVTWDVARSTDLADRALLPLQRRVTLDGGFSRRATERDTVRLTARQLLIRTDEPGGTARSAGSTAVGTYRRRMSIHIDAWLGAGATFATFDHDPRPTASDPDPPDTEPATSDLLPVGEVGIARLGDDLALTGDALVRVTTFVDGFTGEVTALAEAVCGLHWHPARGVAFGSSASAGARPGGETALARADLRASWSPWERLSFQLGITGRLQRERRPDLPSFDEGGSFAGVTWMMQEELALEIGVMGRIHREHRLADGSFVEGAAFVGIAYSTQRLFQGVR